MQQTDNAQQTFYFNNQVVAPVGSYTYDALYRLIQATGRELTALQMPTHDDFANNIPCPDTATNAMQNYTQVYQYDELGNILNAASQGNWTRDYVYNTNNNYLLKHDSQQTTDDYTYDAHGNMLSMPHINGIDWDYQDQLHRATNGTFTSYYNYDAQGNRTRKVVEKGNIIEIRYYIGNYELYQRQVNGSLDFERTTLNISDDEKVFVRIEQKTGENEVIRYQYDNHLGSACLELDDVGQIISYEEYHPFGTTSYRSGRTEIEVSLKRYKYCGKERDEETGLYYYGMRYYAAWICRFVSVDPLQFKYPHYTPYQYAGNRPITMIDLDGTEPEDPQKQKTYTVQRGDTPSGITEKMGVSIWNLAKWNQGQQEGGGYFSDIGQGDYQEYWVEGKGTSWSIKPGDVLNIVGGKQTTTTTNAGVGKFEYNGPIYPRGFPQGGGISPVGLLDPFIDIATEGISWLLQKIGIGEKASDITADIALLAGSLLLAKKAPSFRSNVAKGGVQYTKSSLQLGQQMHKAYKIDLHNPSKQMFKEFRLHSGKKIDFLDVPNKTIYELKPFNPRAMKAGEKQLQMYLKELQSPAMIQRYPEFKGINWKTILDTY